MAVFTDAQVREAIRALRALRDALAEPQPRASDGPRGYGLQLHPQRAGSSGSRVSNADQRLRVWMLANARQLDRIGRDRAAVLRYLDGGQ